LYRLHREREAMEVMDKIADKGRKEEHLDAQIVSGLESLSSFMGF
jgi:signal recognition particle subunit SRP72